MRLGVVWLPSPNANYRAVEPLKAMEGRGHEVAWPPQEDAPPRLSELISCDVVHVYRRADDEIRPVLAELVRRGTPYTYDNDDDFTAVPKQSPEYGRTGGLKGHRYFAATVKVAQQASSCTTTTEVLAEKYRRAGVDRVEVIGNYLAPDPARRSERHDGVIIGWIAAAEHRADAHGIAIGDALRRLIAQHDDVRVECIGVNLGLPDRYRHDPDVPFSQLYRRIGRFDIGIAPLVDTPWNRARSDIKLKEYAASGVPWLASPVGPYAGLGEKQGGRLVPNDGWFDALDQLVRSRRDRRRLGRKARRWAKGQTMRAVADRWEQLFTEAALAAR